MTLKEIYNLIVREGINADPRGKQAVQKSLQRTKQAYQQLSSREQKVFDQERLHNPYSDTRILFGQPAQKIKSILVGIDVETPELMLAGRLSQQGRSIDLALSHHPQGRALAGLAEVMDIHAEMLKKTGIAISVAESLMAERIAEVKRKIMPANHLRSPDAARLLNLPFLCCHTPADNHVTSYLQSLMDKQRPDTLKDILETLIAIPEYNQARTEKAGPRIFAGNSRRQAGKIFVDMTGGTEGSKEVFQKLAQAGVGTIIGMHLSEEHFRKVKAEHINVVIAGHIASDNLGLNLLLDKLERRQCFNIVECSGFKRVKRK